MTNQLQKPLLPQHRELLKASGISEAVIIKRKYYSETVKSELARLGFSPIQRIVPALVVPVWPIDGEPSLHQIRPDQPRYSRGKQVKYETPSGASLQIDVPPLVREKVQSPREPLFITEGVRKADSAASHGLACIGLLGVYGWKQQDEFWRRVPLHGRTVYIVFDSDITSNRNVRRAAAGLFALLESMGAKPQLVTLPQTGSKKTGLDDYFAGDGKVENLLATATDEAPSFQGRAPEAKSALYEADECGIVRVHDTDDGPVRQLVCNFSARITAETIYVSEDLRREFDIEATVRGQRQQITLSAEEFDRMTWPIPRLGADAIIYPGYGARDEVRTAIQVLSPTVRKLIGIDRLGWHRVNNEYVFVHAGGFIRRKQNARDDLAHENCLAGKAKPRNDLSATGTLGTILPDIEEDDLGIRMRIPRPLQRYQLPEPSRGEQLIRDIKASLQLLALAPLQISIPIYAAIWYAAIHEADFSIHIYGSTGNFKTEYVALATQHFGAGLDARHLPTNWSSTPNFIRSMGAHAGNVILPVDDFVPTGSQHDIDRSYRAAEDIFRSQGNAAGRGRCYRDGTPQEPEPPKCLTLSTGEVRPIGHSLTSRVLMLEVHPGDIMDREDPVKTQNFTKAQLTGKSGAYARVMAAFLEWIASDYENQRQLTTEQSKDFRNVFQTEAKHARTVDIAAKLLAGLDQFLDFAMKHGALDEEMHEGIWRSAHEALFEVLKNQETEQADEDPVHRFLDLLRTAFATGRAHLQYLISPSEEEEMFGSPTYFGYQKRIHTERKSCSPNADNENEKEDSSAEGQEILEQRSFFVPVGVRVGWKHLDNLYLEPKESLAVVQRLAKDMNQPPIPINYKALGKRLAEQGLFVSSKKGRNVARVNIEGRKEDVFHLRFDALIELHRCAGDLVDELNEELFQEHEQALHRQEQANKLRQTRRDRVHDFRQQQFIQLLDSFTAT